MGIKNEELMLISNPMVGIDKLLFKIYIYKKTKQILTFRFFHLFQTFLASNFWNPV